MVVIQLFILFFCFFWYFQKLSILFTSIFRPKNSIFEHLERQDLFIYLLEEGFNFFLK